MASTSLLPWILAQAEPAAADAGGDEMTVALRLLAAVGLIVGSFVVGGLLARALRLPEFSFKIGIVVFATAAGVAINVAGWPPKRGIDLSGGVVLVYEVDRESTKPSWMPMAINQRPRRRFGGGTGAPTGPWSATNGAAVPAPAVAGMGVDGGCTSSQTPPATSANGTRIPPVAPVAPKPTATSSPTSASPMPRSRPDMFRYETGAVAGGQWSARGMTSQARR
jgi:hypothetical protein